jgi:hypothetical protein
MTTPRPSGNSRSWDAPACPNCVSDVFVTKRANAKLNHECQLCGEVFSR